MEYVHTGDIIDLNSIGSNINPITGNRNKERFGVVIGECDDKLLYLLLSKKINGLDNRYFNIEGLANYTGVFIPNVVDLEFVYLTNYQLPVIGKVRTDEEAYQIVTSFFKYQQYLQEKGLNFPKMYR